MARSLGGRNRKRFTWPTAVSSASSTAVLLQQVQLTLGSTSSSPSTLSHGDTHADLISYYLSTMSWTITGIHRLQDVASNALVKWWPRIPPLPLDHHVRPALRRIRGHHLTGALEFFSTGMPASL